MDWTLMGIKYRIIFVFLIMMSIAGCKPNDEIDIFEFTFVTEINKVETIAKKTVESLFDENIYPYKPKAGCLIKKFGSNQIFLCIEGNIFKFGAALNPGKIEKNREDFINMVSAFKDNLNTEKIHFTEKYDKNVSIEAFKSLNLYQK